VKKTILKAWPEMEGFAPLLTSPSETSILTTLLYIDFSGCDSIDSCGLTAFLLKIIQYFERVKNIDLKWETNSSNELPVIQDVIRLGFFKPIIHLYQNSLFFKPKDFLINEESIKSTIFGSSRISFPIIYIDFMAGDNRRSQIKQMKKILYDRLHCFGEIYNFNIVQFISILFELSKNSADHAGKNAILGIDVFESSDAMRLNFLYGDFGLGIKQHVEEYLKNNNKQRLEHLSLTEIYHTACSKGFTSKPGNGVNFGLGLSTIIEFAKTMRMSLSVFDASSRGLLSKIDIISPKDDNTSHKKLRDIFFIYSRKNPFCYFGTMEAKKNENFS
jgi:hypothetical protein